MKRNFQTLTAGLVLFAFSFASPALADDSQLLSMVQDLQAQMKGMQKTINQQNDKIRDLERRE